ncbi:hypothetical protein BEWA_021410 [Theileria equi strain WA]|uniref:Uncharacterized protein n=1 Tax=Theileria equi strain WA TaxID=1537102 RepID=L0AVM2_THEEQ|nr:hypothetical protein BEWA_021410 [Theileria equi strain WA]AFZ79293.1 hypothetical protein BEWA_021410 [Theileria equi strain WA]|eukprot:XP_004828959.1 hypothetical protein BEWA_021410 [Theileria equi strain WA]
MPKKVNESDNKLELSITLPYFGVWISKPLSEKCVPAVEVFAHSLRLPGSRPSNSLLTRRFDSFIANNNHRSYLNNYKVSKKTPKHDSEYKISHETTRRSSLYAFGFLKNLFSSNVPGWYVPPIPVGERASVTLRKRGPLQTEEETQMLFHLLGLSEDATIQDVGEAYMNVVDVLPEDLHEGLKHSLEEYLRKHLVTLFEHMEAQMDKGPEAWTEFWNPEKDLLGNPVTQTKEELEKEEKAFLEAIPNIKMDKFLKYWDEQNSRFNRVANAIDLPTLIRFSRNKKEKFLKCLVTMVPVMFAGLFPKFSSLSTAIEALFASKFIYSGNNSHEEEEPDRDAKMNNLQKKTRSTSTKSLVTLAVIFAHSMIGLSVSTLIQLYTNISDFISPQILNTLLINFHIIVSAILYDTSDLPFSEQLRINQEKVSSINDTIGDIKFE